MDPETWRLQSVTWRFQSETPSGLLLEDEDGNVEELTLSHALDLVPWDRELLIDAYAYALLDTLGDGLTEAQQADSARLYAELVAELAGERLAAELASRGWTPQLQAWAHALFCPVMRKMGGWPPQNELFHPQAVRVYPREGTPATFVGTVEYHSNGVVSRIDLSHGFGAVTLFRQGDPYDGELDYRVDGQLLPAGAYVVGWVPPTGPAIIVDGSVTAADLEKVRTQMAPSWGTPHEHVGAPRP